MNEEIKFPAERVKCRGWNPWGKRFYYGPSQGNDNASWVLTNCEAYGHPLMLFSGLKDKDGKEIYEGDILEKYDDDFINLDSDEKIATGIKDYCTLENFRYWLKNETFGYEGEGLEYPCDWKIIGNIYEKPNLLK